MTDRFGRQKSTRWVNSVPTYGDWGDDDYEDDDYTYQEDNSSQQQQRKVTPQRFELPSDHVPPVPVIDEKYKNLTSQNNTESNVSPPKELVLSVDGQTNLESDSSDEESEIISQGGVSPYKEANKQTHGISHNVDEKLKTPAYQANIPVVASHDRSDYNEEDNNDFTRKLNEIQLKESNHEDLAQSEVQEGQKDEPDSVNQVSEPSSTKQQPNLVLSVDTHKNIYSDSSDEDDDDDDTCSNLNFGISTHSLGNIATDSTSKNNVTTLKVQPKEELQFEPPTPTYSYSQQSNIPPESPSMESENSFNSEYSFQKEPVDLQLATHHEETETILPQKDLALEPKEKTEEVETTEKSTQPELVLSVDKPNFKTSDDEDDDDDNWGYNSQNSSNDEKEVLGVPGENSASDIDSFIDNLNKVYSGDPSGEVLPPIDHDLSLPDFENTSFSKYEDDEENYSPIKPLSISQQKEAHDDYLSSFSGRTQSVRKPPRHSTIFTDDFSGIASDETENAPEEQKDDSISENSVPEVVQTNEFELEQNKLGGNNNSDLAPPGLHPVASSGSLSTGKLSMDTASQKQQESQDEESITKDIKDARRVSTLSNATFNLGGWAPNTDNFRNQFIGENDSESINFNTDRSGYDKFTKVRTESTQEEDNANASLPSIPETIDAVMPSIQEDGASDEEEQDDGEEKNDIQDYHGDSHSVLPTMTMSSKSDSVLNEHFYPKPLFKEERLTPAASKEDLLPQKYSSLLPSENRRASDSSDVTARQRSESTSTVTTNSTVQVTPKELVPDKYPVSDWKSIVTISQPVDRIAAFKDALHKEQQYDSKLTSWLHYALKRLPNTSTNLLIGRVASQAYQNAEHNDLRRHASFRSRVNIVKDKVEGTGSFGKKLFSRSKKFIKSTTGDK